MSLLKKLRDAVGGGGSGASARQVLEIPVRCRRCGEIITAQIDLRNDLSADFQRDVYHVRKLVSGAGEDRCFQQIELSLTFDMNRQLLDRQISGGTFVDAQT